MMIIGTAKAFAFTSVFLMLYVESEHRVKRASEVVSTLVTLGVIVYGYAITGSLVLGVVTFFIVALVLFAFVVSYFLPKIRSKPKVITGSQCRLEY